MIIWTACFIINICFAFVFVFGLLTLRTRLFNSVSCGQRKQKRSQWEQGKERCFLHQDYEKHYWGLIYQAHWRKKKGRHFYLIIYISLQNKSIICKLWMKWLFIVHHTFGQEKKKLINVEGFFFFLLLSMTDQKSHEWCCNAAAWIILGLWIINREFLEPPAH